MKSRRVAAIAVTTLASTAFALGPVATMSAFAKESPKPHPTPTHTDTPKPHPTPTNTHKPDYPPHHGHHGYVDPQKGPHAGTTVVTFTADGFKPGELVKIYLNGVKIDEQHADANGAVQTQYTFSDGLKSEQKFTAVGQDTGVKDDANFHLTAFSVPAPTKSGVSGEETATAIGLAALAMLSVGSGSIYTMRRRRKAQHG
jgi:hypothetical protein